MNSASTASVLALVFWTLFAAAPGVAAPLNPQRCAIHARAAEDNDLRLEKDPRPRGRPVPVPRVVVDQIHRAAMDIIGDVDADLISGLTCKDVFRRVSRVSEFGGRQLFVAEVTISVGPDDFLLILYDPATKRATASPPRIEARWPQQFGARDALLKLPIVSSTTRLGGVEPQIIFQERDHNGTLYNAVVYHYFAVGPKLQLTRDLVVEARALDPMTAQDIYVREVQWRGTNRLQLNLYLRKTDGRRRALGYATLARSGPGHPFRVRSLRPTADANPDALVTFCDAMRADQFQKHGCNFAND